MKFARGVVLNTAAVCLPQAKLRPAWLPIGADWVWAPLLNAEGLGNFCKGASRNHVLLEVQVQRAEGLPALDQNGRSDPFVVVSVNRSHERRTAVKRCTLFPCWDETFYIYIPVPGWAATTRSGAAGGRGPSNVFVGPLSDCGPLCQQRVLVYKHGV